MKTVPVTGKEVNIASLMTIRQTPATVNHRYSGKLNLLPEPNVNGNNACTSTSTYTVNICIVGNIKDTGSTNIPNVKVVKETLE